MKWVLVCSMALGLAGCASEPPPMGEAVRELARAQTDPTVVADSVGGSMAGIGEKVGAAYRGDVDKPEGVKDSMGMSFIDR